MHGVHDAIINALKKHPGESLKGATVYSTLIPDHNDSKLIRDLEITRVVFKDDKYPKRSFTIASKEILKGLDWRY